MQAPIPGLVAEVSANFDNSTLSLLSILQHFLTEKTSEHGFFSFKDLIKVLVCKVAFILFEK